MIHINGTNFALEEERENMKRDVELILEQKDDENEDNKKDLERQQAIQELQKK